MKNQQAGMGGKGKGNGIAKNEERNSQCSKYNQHVFMDPKPPKPTKSVVCMFVFPTPALQIAHASSTPTLRNDTYSTAWR